MLQETQGLSTQNKAIKVTLEDVENNIAEVYYVNGEAAISAVSNYTNEHIKCLTLCILTTKAGFVIVGKSACAHPDNFDGALGQKLAREDAISQLWGFMGYHLKEQLFERQQAGGDSHVGRMEREETELNEKVEKLQAFVRTTKFNDLHPAEKNRLRQQLRHMVDYHNVLRDRLAVAKQ